MDRSTSTAARLNWRIHGCLAGWRTWPAPPDTSQSSYDAEAHSSSVIAGQGESGRPSARDPKVAGGRRTLDPGPEERRRRDSATGPPVPGPHPTSIVRALLSDIDGEAGRLSDADP